MGGGVPVRFVALFHALGVQIIPPKQIAGVNNPSSFGAESFSVQTALAEPAVEGGYTIKLPWSQQKDDK